MSAEMMFAARKGLFLVAAAASIAVVSLFPETARSQGVRLRHDRPIAIHGPAGSSRWAHIDVPRGADYFEVQTHGGAGNLTLRVRHAGHPWRPASMNPGNNETVCVHNPAPGRWQILVQGVTAYGAGARLVARYNVPRGPGAGDMIARAAPAIIGGLCELAASRGGGDDDDDDDDRYRDRYRDRDDRLDARGIRLTTLRSGRRVDDLCGGRRCTDFFRVEVPRNARGVAFLTRGGRGNCRLLVSREALPTVADNDHASSRDGTVQAVTISRPVSGTYYARLVGDPAFEDVSLAAVIEDTNRRLRPAPDRLEPDPPTAAADRIRIIGPAADATVAPGGTYLVRWDAAADIRTVVIEVSWDTGRTWNRLAVLPASSGSVSWRVPLDQAASGNVILRISDRGGCESAARILAFAGR